MNESDITPLVDLELVRDRHARVQRDLEANHALRDRLVAEAHSAGCRMSDIAKAAQLSRQMTYRSFPNGAPPRVDFPVGNPDAALERLRANGIDRAELRRRVDALSAQRRDLVHRVRDADPGLSITALAKLSGLSRPGVEKALAAAEGKTA